MKLLFPSRSLASSSPLKHDTTSPLQPFQPLQPSNTSTTSSIWICSALAQISIYPAAIRAARHHLIFTYVKLPHAWTPAPSALQAISSWWSQHFAKTPNTCTAAATTNPPPLPSPPSRPSWRIELKDPISHGGGLLVLRGTHGSKLQVLETHKGEKNWFCWLGCHTTFPIFEPGEDCYTPEDIIMKARCGKQSLAFATASYKCHECLNTIQSRQ